MRKKLLFISMFICLAAALGLADKGLFMAAAFFAVWPIFVLIMNLIISVRRYGW